MKRPALIVTTVAGILLIGGVAVAAGGHRDGFGRGGFGGAAFGGPAAMAPQMAERLIRRLDLDDAQRDEVRAIVDAAQPELRELSDAMRDSREELRELAFADTQDPTALRTTADQQGDLIADMIVLGATVMGDVRAVLTPEQLDQLEEMFENRRRGGDRRR